MKDHIRLIFRAATPSTGYITQKYEAARRPSATLTVAEAIKTIRSRSLNGPSSFQAVTVNTVAARYATVSVRKAAIPFFGIACPSIEPIENITMNVEIGSVSAIRRVTPPTRVRLLVFF